MFVTRYELMSKTPLPKGESLNVDDYFEVTGMNTPYHCTIFFYFIISGCPTFQWKKGQTCLVMILVLGRFMLCPTFWHAALVCSLLHSKVTEGAGGFTRVAPIILTHQPYCFTMKGIVIFSLCWEALFQSCFRKFGATCISFRHC